MNNILRINTTKGDVYLESTVVAAVPAAAPATGGERQMNDVTFLNQNEQVMELAQDTLDKSLDSLTEIARKIAQKVKTTDPKKIEVQFGFKLSGTGDLYIAKCTAEGNFSIKLTWE